MIANVEPAAMIAQARATCVSIGKSYRSINDIAPIGVVSHHSRSLFRRPSACQKWFGGSQK